MVVALRGWFDIAEVATTAINELLADRVAPIVASIDPDPFFDFTQERPFVELDDDEIRHILWPAQRVPVRPLPRITARPRRARGRRASPALRDVRRMRAAGGASLEVRGGGHGRRRCRHHPAHPCATRGRQHDQRRSAAALGLSPPRYQGITGLVGVLQERLDRAGVPAVSLRVGVPHYLGNANHPQSSIALLQHLHHVLGVPVHTARLAADAARRRVLHDEAVAEDEQASAYVAMLEREYDQKAEEAIPSGDDLAADFERFLREQRDDEG